MPSSISNSDNAYPAVKTTFFDPEHVDRPVPQRPWRGILIGALALVVVLTIGWEFYWRGKGMIPGDFKNTEALWSAQRRLAKDDATVIIGSSRALFDIDLDIWEEISGVRPIQLSLEGTSPRIFLKDLANDEAFRGTVVVGVTSILFFTQEGGFREAVLKYIQDQTLSQKVGHQLSKPIERTFAFFDEQTRPKRQMQIAPLPLREGMTPRFDPRKLEIMDEDRNTEMWSRVVDDPVYQKEAQDQWLLAFTVFAPPPGPDGQPAPMPQEAIDGIFAELNENIGKIRARGGEVVFIRAPFAGAFTEVENMGFPRERFWDPMLVRTDSPGVSFQDYPEMQGLTLPEWSHLSPEDSKKFTRALVPAFYAALEAKKAERAAR